MVQVSILIEVTRVVGDDGGEGYLPAQLIPMPPPLTRSSRINNSPWSGVLVSSIICLFVSKETESHAIVFATLTKTVVFIT